MIHRMVHLDTNNNVRNFKLEKTYDKLDCKKDLDFISGILNDCSSKIIQLGGCPVCKIGSINKSITWFGLLTAILLFPFGIWVCLTTRENKCSNCQAIYE